MAESVARRLKVSTNPLHAAALSGFPRTRSRLADLRKQATRSIGCNSGLLSIAAGNRSNAAKSGGFPEARVRNPETGDPAPMFQVLTLDRSGCSLEGEPERIRRLSDSREFIFAESEYIPGQRKFLPQIGLEDSGIVGIQRDRHTGIEQSPYRVRGKRRHGPRSHVTRNANLQRDPLRTQTPHQFRIVHGANAMANSFRPDLERGANGSRPIRLSRMRGQSQASVFRVTVGIAEAGRRAAQLIAADAERNRTIAHAVCGEARDIHDVVRPELPDRVQIPLHLDRPLLLRLTLRFADGPPYGSEIEPTP